MHPMLMAQSPPGGRLKPAYITFIYVMVGIIWVIVTDGLLADWIDNVAELSRIHALKSIFFILASAVLLHVLIRRGMAALHRSQQQLQDKHAQLSALIEGTTDGIYLKDLQGRNVLINTIGATYLGRTVEEVIGRDNTELLPPETARRAIAEDRQVIASGRPQVFEHEATLGGITRVWSIAKAPYRDAHGRISGVIGIARDITERKQLEQALQKARDELEAKVAERTAELQDANRGLQQEISERRQAEAAWRESEERFRQLAENIHEVFYLTNPANDQMLYISPQYEEVWGRSCESLYEQPRSWAEALLAEDRERIFAAFERQERSGHFDEAYRIMRPDGTIRWIHARSFPIRDATGSVYRLAGIAEDITERRQAEEALRESEERFRQLVEHLDEVFWIANADGSQVLYVSPAYEKIRGHPPECIYANPADWIEAIHPEDQSRLPDIHAEIVNTGKCEEEYRIIRPDGAVRWIWSRGFPIRDAAGHIYRIAGIAQDITGRKTNEEKLRQQQAELAHLARFALAGEMASGLAHELNQPLGAIGTYTETCLLLIRSGPPDSETLIETLEQVTAQAQRAGEIIRRLRNLVRKAEPQRSPVNVNDLIQDTLALIEPEARQQAVQIRLERDEALPCLFADSIQIQQVILNLVRNALEAMSESQTKPRILTIHTAPAGSDTFEVAVSDTGPGLSSEGRERLFMPFFTTKPTGMGLGLSLSKSIIEAHGGNLWATANPDRGVTFHFTLPYEPRKRPR